jgi:nitroreductase
MEVKEAIGRRRSIRFFRPWQPVEREKVQTVLEAARLASRAMNADFAQGRGRPP